MIDIKRNKELKIGDKIDFMLGSRSIQAGMIIEKNLMKHNVIDFKIQISETKFCRQTSLQLCLIN